MRPTHVSRNFLSLVAQLERRDACQREHGNRYNTHIERNAMANYTREELVARMTRAGELEVSGDHPEEAASYFDTETFVFHGPDSVETDYAGLSSYFASVRSAFGERRIRRGIVVVEGDVMACQTWIEGTFLRTFTQSPIGAVEPNGARVVMDLINIFRFDDQGRLVEEFVRTDNRSILRQLGG